MTTPKPASAGKQLTGTGVGFMLAQLIVFFWPDPNGQPWTPEAATALGGVLTALGLFLAPWMPSPPSRRTASVLLACALGLPLVGCAEIRGPSGLDCSAIDAGGYVDCSGTAQGGRLIYLEGFKGEIGIPATTHTTEMTITITEATNLQIQEGPSISANAQDQDKFGDAIVNLSETVRELAPMAAGGGIPGP